MDKYIRADLCITLAQSDARVGAALREAAEVIANIAEPQDIPGGCLIPDTFERGLFAAKGAIIALAPTATAAFDRAIERMRERCAAYVDGQALTPDEIAQGYGFTAYYPAVLASALRTIPLHEEPEI